MRDSKVSLNTTIAWVAWALSGVLTLLTLIVDSYKQETTTGGMVLCTFAIIAAAAAATLHTRSFLCQMCRSNREMFEFGKDAGRLEAVPAQRSSR